jgi:hypothetical protein
MELRAVVSDNFLGIPGAEPRWGGLGGGGQVLELWAMLREWCQTYLLGLGSLSS